MHWKKKPSTWLQTCGNFTRLPLGDGREMHAGPTVFKQGLKHALTSTKEPLIPANRERLSPPSSAPPPVPRMSNAELDSVEISGLHSIVEESFSVPPLAGPGVSNDGQSNLRWLVERDGVIWTLYSAADFGPVRER